MSLFQLGGAPVKGSEIIWIGLLLLLALLAIVAEMLRQIGARPAAPRRQFRMRMLGGGVMLLLVAMLAFGVLFLRPEDGPIFGWYWGCCALVLLGLVLILRQDVALITAQTRDDRARVRDERLKEMQEMIDGWRPEKTMAPGDTEPASDSETALSSPPSSDSTRAPDSDSPPPR